MRCVANHLDTRIKHIVLGQTEPLSEGLKQLANFLVPLGAPHSIAFPNAVFSKNRHNPAIEGEWLKAGVFASPVDFDSYFKKSAFDTCDKFVTDDRDQCLYYKSLGYFQHIPEIHADLGEIAAGIKPGREAKDERIICANLGLAMDDMATAVKIYQKAVEGNIGTWLEL